MISQQAADIQTPRLGFRGLSISRTFSGQPENACQELLHPIFQLADEVTVIVSAKSLDSIAGMTCGMGPLVGAETRLHLIVVSPEPLNEGTLVSKGVTQRLSILSDLQARKLLRTTVVDHEDLEKDFAPETLGSGLALITDTKNDSVSVRWELPLDCCQPNEVVCSVLWSFGDPLKTVQKLLSSVSRLGKVTQSSNANEWQIEFRRIIEKIEPATPPFTEDFSEVGEESDGITLYDHQKYAIEKWILQDRQGIFKMCTGSGKTITSLSCIPLALPPNGPVLVTVPTRVLADQWIEQIKRMGYSRILRAYESSAGWLGTLEPWMRSNESAEPRFVVTTYKTFTDDRFLAKIERLSNQGVTGVWIADELHNLASPRLLHAMAQMETMFPQRIGLSATPEIERNEPATERIAEFFGGVCATYDLVDGIRDGVLCPYRYYPIPAYLDPQRGEEYLATLEGIESSETKPMQLIELYRQSREIIRKSGVQLPSLEAILDSLIERGESLDNTLVYCPPGFSNAETSDDLDVPEEQSRILEEVVAAFRNRGLSVSSIVGATPKLQRDEIIDRFSKGSLSVLCAIGCLDEGIDIPSIQRAIVLYSIDREKQFIQRRGRILRVPRGISKVAEIFDVVILPHGTTMGVAQTEQLLSKELKRYRAFSDLALNADEARETIRIALDTATQEIISI